MTDDEYIKQQIKALEESVAYYRPGNQAELDSWVVGSFLENCGIEYESSEIVVPDADPPDVRFRLADFEVKEILDPGRKRHAEYKAALAKAQKATDLSELSESYTPVDLKLSELLTKLETKCEELRCRYAPDVKRHLDLLVYVNLQHIERIIPDIPLASQVLESSGWRSISFVKGHLSGVVCAAADAPNWLNSIHGKLYHRWMHENDHNLPPS